VELYQAAGLAALLARHLVRAHVLVNVVGFSIEE
jgi:hypothetical protein